MKDDTPEKVLNDLREIEASLDDGCALCSYWKGRHTETCLVERAREIPPQGESWFPREWEMIDAYTDRLRVPFGWLVRSQYGDSNSGSGAGATYSQSLCFVADSAGAWRLEEVKTP